MLVTESHFKKLHQGPNQTYSWAGCGLWVAARSALRGLVVTFRVPFGYHNVLEDSSSSCLTCIPFAVAVWEGILIQLRQL